MTIQRIVCFQFQANLPEEAKQQHLREFAQMKEEISQILECRTGLTLPGDFNTAPEYDSMHYMTFASAADVEIYFNHAAHQRFIQRNKDSWQKVFVLNAEIA